jgi:hypothetical protein
MVARKIKNPREFRNKMGVKLNEYLTNPSHGHNLEIGIYNYALKECDERVVVKKWSNPLFVEIYLNRLKTVLTNITNPYLLNLLQTESIKPHEIAFMTHQQMNPEKWEKIILAKTKRDVNKFEVTMKASTDTFKCKKCGKNNCVYDAVQTRSADEATTLFVTCLDCGCRFKKN